MKNVFNTKVSEELIDRIQKLSVNTQPTWGKMSVDQMLAHVNVPYEMVYEPSKHPRPNFIVRFIVKLLAKNMVVSEKPYPKNSRTAPQFIMVGDKDFELEKNRLINHIRKTQELGNNHFDGLASNSLGNLTATEWSNMFYKHLDHHLIQFGV